MGDIECPDILDKKFELPQKMNKSKRKLQISQPIVFKTKEIRMGNILFGQVEKIIQSKQGIFKNFAIN